MNLSNLVKSLLNLQKEINVKKLPSQGLFYKDDFKIFIKRAKMQDISDYEYNYSDDISVIIKKIKKIVQDNTKFSNKYRFEDIKSIDIIYIFLEIVKFTKGEPIYITGIDLEFSSDNFNYFKISDELMKSYNKIEKCFIIDGYKFTLPSIGIENSLTSFLITKSNEKDSYIYNKYFYDFTYFSSDKNQLTFDEIDNLIQIFNFDIEKEELEKIVNIVKIFQPMQMYSLIKDGNIIEMTSRIDLEKIWK